MNQRKDSLTIRRIQKNDMDSLFNLLQNLSESSKQFFHPHSFNKQTLIEIFTSGKDHYFVMLLNNTLIGYSFLRLFGHTTPRYGCCIDRQFEQKGYGTILTKWTIKTAKQLGYSKIMLKVYKENTIALDMYNKMGFNHVETNNKTKEIIMEKTLK
jgi:ribosomal-protein-alanine N-acetyltransferase